MALSPRKGQHQSVPASEHLPGNIVSVEAFLAWVQHWTVVPTYLPSQDPSCKATSRFASLQEPRLVDGLKVHRDRDLGSDLNVTCIVL